MLSIWTGLRFCHLFKIWRSIRQNNPLNDLPLVAKGTPCLRSRDCEFRIEDILMQTRLYVGTESAEL